MPVFSMSAVWQDICFALPEFLATLGGLAVGWQTRGSPYPCSLEPQRQSLRRFGVRELFEFV